MQTLQVAPSPDHDTAGKKVMQTDLALSRDGRMLYDLYRGANCVMVFAVEEATGLLRKVQELPLGGAGNPRGMAVAPDGRFVLVADNDNHRVLTLAVNPDGTLCKTGRTDSSLPYPGKPCFYTTE